MSTGHSTSGAFRMKIKPQDVRGTLVQYSCPLCRAGLFPKRETYIANGTNLTIVAPNQFKQRTPGKYNTALLISSILPVTVLVTSNYSPTSLDTFLALPIESLSNKYILVNYE
ncbi:hypothetical protein PoB_006664000 [Plakobranchus ocellatus]|uniref:LITAF domain-containing protein n=1 Tax=Plakobranchus ocellatus TaxID=259542 RepID=A0AAV4D7N6_9GAST|nr:hypothetical protein PoB_006664000 [Plakobranchus ocellatus]